MTEYELFEVAVSYNSVLQGWLAIYLTIFSGYLVTAYAVGSKLSRTQVVFVSASFSVFAVICIHAAVGSAAQVIQLNGEIEAINPDRYFRMGDTQMYFMATVMSLGVLMGIAFMWGRRKNIN